MVMVLDAFASYLGDYLKQVVEDELGTMLGVSGEINKMGDKLQDLKNFLADADRRNITDETVQVWVGQLKRAMYEAADILDLCQLKAMERGPSTAIPGFFNPLLFCMRNPFHAHEIGTRIKALNKSLDSIKERSAAFNFINLGSYEDHSSNIHASGCGNPSHETSGDLDRSWSGLVGDQIKEDTRALVSQIMRPGNEVNTNIIVFAIVGVGGIGKTTLAQKVFHDEVIQCEFSKRIWLSIDQNFSEIELLTRAISAAGGNHLPAGNAKATLHQTLKDTLIGHKTLLVMDDVWNPGAWEGVLKIPFVNAAAPGSQVLITTRDEGVALGMAATWPYHHIGTLGPDDAWSLLKKQALSSEIDENHLNMLKDVGLKIIQKCGGLPLSIKIMGGLLRKRGKLRCDWEHVLDDSKWSTTRMPHELNYPVYLSYEDMPPYLKQCFLYYSLLPKSRSFHVDQVVGMWISEGFIHGNSNDLEESGRNYYNELISRNLIEPNINYVDQYYCSMHDVVRSFAQYMTKDEAFTTQDGDNDMLTRLSSQKFLRLSMQSGDLDWKSLQEQQSVRTLISTTQINLKPGDSLAAFSSLRTLHIESADVAALAESLHQLKHLRYVALLNTDISVLPVSIGKMKLLQFLDLGGCTTLVNLPDSIVKLGQLRLFDLPSTNVIPRGFHGLTSMRRLHGFRAHVDGDWCSLDELGPLSQLRRLHLVQLENVPAASFPANSRLCEKRHLTNLFLWCTSKLGDDGLLIEKEGVSNGEQERNEKVFDELCPPPSIVDLSIRGYFGQQLPSWMMSTSMVSLNNLKYLWLEHLACCTQLPNGLCQLPYLQMLQVDRAPCIRRVGSEFLQAVAAPFPRLNAMKLVGMVEWEDWEWEEQIQAMPRLETLLLGNCKLRRAPPGLASNARALKILIVIGVHHLNYLESFSSVVELTVHACPDLERITSLPNLQKLIIKGCPKLKMLESIPALEWLVLENYAIEELPEYMRDINPRHLQLLCRIWLVSSLAAGQSGPEWDKFSHVDHVQAYARDGNNQRKWYVLYTRRDNFKLDSNISSSTIFEENLSSSIVDALGFESVCKMRRSTFSYICSLVRIPFFEDMMSRDQDHTFVDGRVLSLQDRVFVALAMLNSGGSPVTVGFSLGVNESTVSLVTQVFVEAMRVRAMHHLHWPGYTKMEKIKRKFDKIHGLPNCCGVIHIAHIKFGSQSRDHEENGGILMQALIDPDMRFTNIWLGSPGSMMNQLSVLHDSDLFKMGENGTLLNGNKLKVSLGGGLEVGEYIIGGAGYPLRPWLLTPYQLENDLSDLDSKVEFNKRNFAAIAVVLRALARLKGTHKCLRGEGPHLNNQGYMFSLIYVCCMLNNIVIDMEEEQSAGIVEEKYYIAQVRQIADEDAIRMRDVLSQHLIESREILSSSMVDIHGFTSMYKMRRSTFSYICSLVRVPFLEDMTAKDHTFVDGRVLSLQDRVAVALVMLNSGVSPVTVGLSLGVNETTVSLVTQVFVEAMCERAMHYLCWPGSAKMEKIKRKFDKIHGLPNCCGVVHTAHIKFGTQNRDHEENDGILMQALIDPDMRFTNICLVLSGSIMNKLSVLHDSDLFKMGEKGTCLNGNKLKVTSGGGLEVGEYIIGDAGYPLRPWLLTPYQLENDLSDSDSKVEFNRRHSAATAIALRALARLKDTWKCLQGEGWHPNNKRDMCWTIGTCVILHNILIDMEMDEGAGMPSNQEENYIKQVRQVAEEDGVRARDALSQHLIENGETLSSCMVDAQGFELVYKMRRSTFSYICSLVRVPFLEDMMVRDHKFVDGRVLSLQDRVAIALRMLNCGEPPATVGYSLGVDESTVSLVTQRFVGSWARAFHHISWPGSAKLEKIKSKFDKIHGLPNCCGAVHTAHITFGSQNNGHEENVGMLMQVVVDPDFRFSFIWLGPSGSMNQLSVLYDSWLFKSSQEGTALNGSKMKLSDGSEIGEYIIGDAGYPLLPWLLTPYHLQDKDLSADFSPYQAEFNRRHASASTVTLAALTRLKDTWKILDRAVGSCPPFETIYACCTLHNIVIDREEEEEGVGMPINQENYIKQVRRVADENAIRTRDSLSQHLIKSGVHTKAAEEEQEAAAIVSGSGDGNKEQEAHRQQNTDRGKEKVHVSSPLK
ncbi:hypothetical protein ACQJBY_070157 [Aegilops geniculata]